ncbi:hypothetical protein, partial [Burkholderia cenocepacia]|uniref:hypothetical protein n=1 Tax=Burkholderia cenocepacia TaxID=95486 RepID=UPI002AB7B9F4
CIPFPQSLLSPAIQLLIDRIFNQDAISSPQLCRPETAAHPLLAIPIIRLQESSPTDGARPPTMLR